MIKHFILVLIIIYGIISRFWLIERVPPLINDSVLYARYLTSILNIGSSFLLYFYVKRLFNSNKLALISSFIFLILPWTIQEGRIVSQPNNFLFIFLLSLVLGNKIRSKYWKSLFYIIIIPLGLKVFYPAFWILRTDRYYINLKDSLANVLTLISSDFLFFKNPTFWWGGIRDFGVMLVTFTPLFYLGLYQIFLNFKKALFHWIIIILIISAISPFFPESREFYLVTPFITIFLSLGLYVLCRSKNGIKKAVLSILLVVVLYDLSQFYHYYFIHYPKRVYENLNKIHEEF